MHDRPEKIPARQKPRGAREASPPIAPVARGNRTLGELVDAMAPHLVDLRIRATGVEVEVLVGARRMRFHREIPEGDHDVTERAIETLEDADAAIAFFRGQP